ncbi:histone H3 methyltransferase, partial [Globisporangium splendens]
MPSNKGRNNHPIATRHKKIVAVASKVRRGAGPGRSRTWRRVGQSRDLLHNERGLTKESRLVCQFPDHGWDIPPSPTAMLKLPQGCAAPQLKSSWQPTTRLLEFTLLGEGIGGDTPVVILVLEKLAMRATVPTSTRGGQVIDGLCAFVIPKLLPGQITGAKRWLPFSCCPGTVSDVPLAFCVNGTTPLGGKILIELPADGWDMDDRPNVRLRSAHYHNAAVPATWDRTQHALEIMIPTGAGATPIPMKSNVVLTIASVQDPFKETGGDTYAGGINASARITTLSASSGVIDGPDKLDVARISELRESDFDIASRSFDKEYVEKSGVVAVETLSDVLKRAHVHLSEEVYQSLVVTNLPLRMHAGHSSDSAAGAAVASSPQLELDGEQTSTESSIPNDQISKAEFLNLFARVYAPAYKFGQELRSACGRGHVEKVREWISRGCDPNAKDGSGWSALHYAADFGHLDVVQILLECATTPKVSPSSELGTSVHHQVDVNTRDACGWTPLMRAAANGHTKIVEVLLHGGADPLLTSVEGRTALHWAGSRGMDETMSVLLKAGAVIDHVDRSGWSALHCAILHGSAQCATLLLEQGATKSLKDKLHYPPAHYGEATLQVVSENAGAT